VPRAVLLLVLAGLAAFSIVSHFVPVELGFKALVIGLPCVLFGGGFVYLLLTENRRSASRGSLKTIARYAMGTVTYVVLALGVTGVVSDSVGNSTGCPPGVSGICYKTATWAIHGHRYYELWPYDARGNSINNAPWAQITEDEYITGAGADFRQADGFGICIACLAYLMLAGKEVSEAAYAAQRGMIILRKPLAPL
jgi:hypothetical protein